jgi:glutamate-ammonia-ligase adenylyltransferase
MILDGLLTRMPRPTDPERGQDVVAALSVPKGPTCDLIHGAAASAPFLADCALREADWLSDAIRSDPDAAVDGLFQEIEAVDGSALAPGLRRVKRRMALWIALMDLGGVWPLERVTSVLTDFADKAVTCALETAVGAEVRRGKLPGMTEADIASAGGLAVLAMGKMGAGELNYSSDIDLICLFDETRFDPDDYADARASFVRAVRRMTQTLSERTADGYVFRTDLRLRPDASVTPVAISMEAAERYYESFGRTWERAAYIKARPAAGDVGAGQRFLDALRPFVWRRHLDYAAIQDAHDMRLRIRDHKGLHRAAHHLGHDLKLGQGGIREIEFFTQTRQLIAGGRDPDLRSRGTVSGLTKLGEKDWIGADDVAALSAHYRVLREAEHRVQMLHDQRTHQLPATEEDFVRFANLSGRDAGDLAEDLNRTFRDVHRLTEGFFAPGQTQRRVSRSTIPEQAREVLDRWPGYPALRSRRAVEIFNRVQPTLMDRLAESARPDEALLHFDSFLAGLPAGVQVFALFEANPQLLDLVVDIVDTAPGLAQYLARNAGVFDAVIGGGFFEDWPGEAALTADLVTALNEVDDYEGRLDRARIWAREWHFRIGVHHLRGLIPAAEAGRQYADLADAAIRAIWPHVIDDFARKHGPPPGRGATILGMGSLGARRLNAASDLDLIVIYDGAGIEASDGRRPLATRAYYARLTQALVTAVSAPTAEGRLYEVDMRLRPSGRQGPVATGLESFRTYQREEAWTWEHLALTRARTIAGPEDLCAEVEGFRATLLRQPRNRVQTLADVAEMRARLAAAKPAGSALDIKAGPGRLQDIELLAQTGALLEGCAERGLCGQLVSAAQAFGLSEEDHRCLDRAARQYWKVQAAARLISTGPLVAEDVGAGAAAFLTRETGAASVSALAEDIPETASIVAGIIDKCIGAATSRSGEN